MPLPRTQQFPKLVLGKGANVTILSRNPTRVLDELEEARTTKTQKIYFSDDMRDEKYDVHSPCFVVYVQEDAVDSAEHDRKVSPEQSNHPPTAKQKYLLYMAACVKV